MIKVFPRILAKKLWRDIQAYRAQFIALCTIVALGVLVYSSLVIAMESLNRSYSYAYEELRFADFTITLNPVHEDIISQLKDIDNVKDIEGRLVVNIGVYISESRQIPGVAIGINSSKHPTVNDIKVERGRYFYPGELNTCLVERHFASSYGYGANRTITLIINGVKTNFTAVGIVASPEYLVIMSGPLEISSGYTFGVFFLPLKGLQNILYMDSMINEVSVRVKNRAKIEDTINRFQEILRPYGVIRIIRREEQPSYRALQWDLRGFSEISRIFPALVLAVSAIGIHTMLSRLIISQRREIGILKAMGYSKTEIATQYLLYSTLVGIIGSFIGGILSIPLSRVITMYYTEILGIPFRLFYTNIYAIVEAVLAGIIFCIAGGLIPCFRVVQLSPSEAMRPYISSSMMKGRIPLLEKLVNKIYCPPIRVRMSLRNLFRNRIRTFSTVAGVSLSIMLVLSMYGMMDSFYVIIGKQYGEYERWDLRAQFSSMRSVEQLISIAGWNGVEQAEPTIVEIVKVSRLGKEEYCTLFAFRYNTTMHTFSFSEGSKPRRGQLVISINLAKKLGVSVGDKINVSTPFSRRTLGVSGISDEPLALSTCFVTLETAQELYRSEGKANSVLLRVASGKVAEVRRKLYSLQGVQRVDTRGEMLAEWNKLLDQFTVFSYVMLLMGLTIAFALVFNTATINVLERTWETATMRIIGIRMKTIATMVILENLVMGIFGIALGLVLGYIAAYYFIHIFTSSMVGEFLLLKLYIRFSSYIEVVAGTIATVFLSQVLAIRFISRLNLAEVVKSVP